MRPLAILIAGEPVPLTQELRGGFGSLIREATGPAWPGAWRDVDCVAGKLPDFEEVAAVVVSGSAASVTAPEPWMLRTADWLKGALGAGVPTLGICFGHQLLAVALGGRVEPNPSGREIGTVELFPIEFDRLIGADEPPLLVNMTHVDSVTHIPPGSRLLARTALEPHAALRLREWAWSVQFHPEIDEVVLRHYLDARSSVLSREGLQLERILADLRPAPAGVAVLRRFAALVGRLETGARGADEL